MIDKQLIKTLKRKCDELEAQLEQYRRLISELQAALVNLQGTIALFERDEKPIGKPSLMSVANIYKRGELVQTCISMLAGGAVMTTSELASRCLTDRGFDASDRHLHRAMTQQLVQVLTIQRDTGGKIISPGKRGIVRLWALAEKKAA